MPLGLITITLSNLQELLFNETAVDTSNLWVNKYSACNYTYTVPATRIYPWPWIYPVVIEQALPFFSIPGSRGGVQDIPFSGLIFPHRNVCSAFLG